MNVGVDLWSWPLDAADVSANALLALLSDDERMRAERIRHDAVRQGFILARGRMRQILARYGDGEASGLRFIYGPNGKPALEGSNLQFNLSHTAGLAVLAVTKDFAIGADIEAPRPVRQGLCKRFFSAAENAALAGLSPSEWTEGFFAIWTAKEAIAKALGLGLKLDFKSFDIDGAASAQTLPVSTAAGQCTQVSYKRFRCRPHIHGCVAAVTDRPIALQYRSLEKAVS